MHIQDLIDAQESRRKKPVKNKIVDQIDINKELTDLWNSNDEKEWSLALERYWPLIQSGNISLEKDMENLNANDIKEMTADEFYYFLHDKYFVWKFVEYRSTIQGYLERYQNENRISDLKIIKDRIFNFDLQDTKQGLRIVTSIHGLGIPGASGLLALLFPKNFGTVDQFLVKALQSIEGIKEEEILNMIKPTNITLLNSVKLIEIMKDKANTLNIINKTNYWTPRHIDKVLWTYGR